jgi:hypothetical protein
LVHQSIILGDTLEHLLFACLHQVTSNYHFFQYEVCLVKVENQIELAHVPEVLVKYFDKVMDNIENNQFIVIFLNTRGEIQTGVALEYDLIVSPLKKMREATTSPNYHAAYL